MCEYIPTGMPCNKAPWNDTAQQTRSSRDFKLWNGKFLYLLGRSVQIDVVSPRKVPRYKYLTREVHASAPGRNTHRGRVRQKHKTLAPLYYSFPTFSTLYVETLHELQRFKLARAAWHCIFTKSPHFCLLDRSSLSFMEQVSNHHESVTLPSS